MIDKIKLWFNNTALPWLKISWIQIVNFLIVMFAYNQLNNTENMAISAILVGGWGFILAGYWLLSGLWKWIK